MDEREVLVAKITESASKEAKDLKLNAAQTKLYISEQVKKAVEEYDEAHKQAQGAPTKDTPQIPVNTNTTQAQENTNLETKNQGVKIKKYIVHTPVPNYCGEVAGVQFAYGKAEVKPGWILNWFKERGYKIEEINK